MANKKVNQLTSKPAVNLTDLFLIADPTSGQAYKTTISDLGTAIGSGVSSVNSLVGAVVLDTDDIQELVSPTNKWFTDTRARAALSASSPLTYNSGTGAFGIQVANGSQNGYLSSADWNTFNNKMPAITFNSPLFIASGGDVSITLATTSANGYLSSTDWNTFNGKQAALSGTGFVKISGTTISYDNSTYALDSAVVKLAGTQTITGDKGFTAAPTFDSGAGFKNPSGLYNYITATDTGWKMPVNFNKEHIFVLSTSTAYTYTFPSATGTLALTSDLSSYLPLSGGTLTGALSGTSATFTGQTKIETDGSTPQFFIKETDVTGQGSTAYFQLSNNTIYIGNGNASYGTLSDKLTIASSGAATFSSSVTATQLITSVSSGTNQLVLQTGGIDRGYIQASNASLLLNSVTGNDIQFQGNGSTKMVITSSGNVGIGTSSPAGKLSLYDTSDVWINISRSSSYVNIGVDSTGTFYNTNSNHRWLYNSGSNEAMRITSSGNVGIGTTAPAHLLQLGSGANTGSQYARFFGSGSDIYIGESGGVLFGLSARSAGYVISDNSSNPFLIGTIAGQPLLFGTANTERMRITSAGSVGIGTSSPDSFFSSARNLVVGTGSGNNGMTIFSGSAAVGDIAFADAATDPAFYSGLIRYDHSLDAMRFFTASAERMRITSSGNVGIGNTDPDSKLKVTSSTNSSWATQIINSGSTDAHGLLVYTGASSTGIPFIVYSQATERMRITSGGDVYIAGATGTGATGFAVYSNGAMEVARASGIVGYFNRTGTDGDVLQFRNDGTAVGSISVSGSATAYNTSSDYRLKEDLKPIKGLEIVNKIKVYDYKWKSEDSRMDGVLAHELAEVLPYAVSGVKDGDEMQGVDYSKIVPVLIQSIKELKSKIETLENK